jgi:hypothetical protein
VDSSLHQSSYGLTDEAQGEQIFAVTVTL